MYLIGIHDGHNSSVVLMKNGEIIDAVQEERFNKIKNFGGFPILSLDYILKKNFLKVSDIFEFIFASELSYYRGLENRQNVIKKYKKNFYKKNSLIKSLKKKIYNFIPKIIVKEKKKYRFNQISKIRKKPLLSMGVKDCKIVFVEHHLCHASSAAYGSGNTEETLVVTLDGAGDNCAGSVYNYNNGYLKKIISIPAEYSLGKLYSSITFFLGMVPLEHEYKVMGLAPYSENSKQSHEVRNFLKSLYYYDSDLTFKLTKKIDSVDNIGLLICNNFKEKRFDSIAAGVQLFLEDFVTDWILRLVKYTKLNNLVVGGGVFMNVKLNKKISDLDCIKSLFVFPSCGDETNSFGSVYYRYYQINSKTPKKLSNFYLGNSYTNEEVFEQLKNYSFKNCKIKVSKIDDIDAKVAQLINQNQIVGRFKGRMEFGARSLGNRAILCNPTMIDLVMQINKMIKNRDFWMPFAPSIINEDEYINNPKKINMDYMMVATSFKKEFVNKFKAVIHPYDQSCRPNVVNKSINEDYYNLIYKFKEISGYGVILNTSLNLHGLPIVCTPSDAFYVLDNSKIKYLAIENFLIEKINF
jgi:carbamoyltransferase